MIFPLAVLTVSVFLDGHRIAAYNAARLQGAHVRAPILPFVGAISQRIAFENGTLTVMRDGRTVRLHSKTLEPTSLRNSYVDLAPLARALGFSVVFDSRKARMDLRSPSRAAVAPFSPQTPAAAPTVLFTPEPIVTPRPQYTGTPHPRRTPLVIGTSTPQRRE